MSYRTYTKRGSRRIPGWLDTALLVMGISFVFVVGVTFFRRLKPDVTPLVAPSAQEIVESLTEPTSAAQGVLSRTPTEAPQTITLSGISATSAFAVAKRVVRDGVFTHTILAQGLPDIDAGREHYQAWLVRPYPFEFFATGRLVFNADGSWGMLWDGESGKTYDEFVEVLVTREPNDFDDNPSANQVLKGMF